MNDRQRVLFISGMYPSRECPQFSIFNHELALALKRLRYDVDVICPLTPYSKTNHPCTDVLDGIKVRYIRYFKFPRDILYNISGWFLYRALRTALPVGGKRYDMIHAHAPLPEGDAARLLAAMHGIPYVVHVHGLDVYNDVSYFKNPLKTLIVEKAKRVFKDAAAVLCVSDRVKDIISSRQGKEVNLSTVYNGVNLERFYPEVERAKDGICRIISVGNLIDIKGHRFIIKVLPEVVSATDRKISCTIVGRGPKLEELKALAAEYGVSEVISFPGYLPPDEVADLMRKADIFVLPSYYEALGCVYLEAMACGLATVACKGQGIDEIVTDAVTGMLVEPMDLESLKQALIRLVSDEEFRDQVARNGCRLVREMYTWDHSACKLARVYDKVGNKCQE